MALMYVLANGWMDRKRPIGAQALGLTDNAVHAQWARTRDGRINSCQNGLNFLLNKNEPMDV
jgi:hypothetical protein